ncbi:hypothetical protein [Streptomyces cinnamoneus]|uniref:hypothetical protein n=1 Tax=Streptomyces cinnamoneus TaxID=53446 RepID=UPI0037B1808F
MSSEYTTPSQAEGERDDEVEETREQKTTRETHPMTTRTTPSQAEGERATENQNDKQ